MKEYLDIIYKYYPKDIDASDLNYSNTPEIGRYIQLQNYYIKNTQTFDTLSAKIADEFNQLPMDYSLQGIFDFSYKAILYIPESLNIKNFSICVFYVSVVAKYYCIYLTQSYAGGVNSLEYLTIDVAEQNLINRVEKCIKIYYPDYEPFPMEYFEERVPRISSGKRYLDNATYFECLITDTLF
ncbi:MAG: hypothetical protein JWR12_507 [Mucilaginibacter sp.]|nr:hypothetical protein [Mucilaginibacter sp.]